MKIVELIIDEEAEVFGIEAISLVDRPAIELDFVALKDQKVQFAEMDSIYAMLNDIQQRFGEDLEQEAKPTCH